MNVQSIQDQVLQIAGQFAQDRHDRQRRRELDPADIALLKEAGFYHIAVPIEQGGVWENVPRSTRPVGEMLRTLAGGDASLALVASMHPGVLIFWLATPDVPAPHAESDAVAASPTAPAEVLCRNSRRLSGLECGSRFVVMGLSFSGGTL